MIDQTRPALFQALGATHGLFGGVTNWAAHTDLRKQLGAAGNPDAASTLLAQMIRGGTGMVCGVQDGSNWAIRCLPDPFNPDAYLEFGFCLEEVASVQNATDRYHCAPQRTATTFSSEDERRRQFGTATAHLRLGARAEAILWLLHATILSQRSSRVLLPDVTVGELLWGPDHDTWPKNWRRDALAVPRSLCLLRWARLGTAQEFFDNFTLASRQARVLAGCQPDGFGEFGNGTVVVLGGLCNLTPFKM